MEVRIESGWKDMLQTQFEQAYFTQLVDFVKHAYQTTRVLPPAQSIFAAFDLCPWDEVRVVILGQDPYHSPGQAHGLCFSVPDGIDIPPSLKNIFAEVTKDLREEENENKNAHNDLPHNDLSNRQTTGNLTRWATQGVLLLNSVLTVQAHTPASHANQGWETFTDAVIAAAATHKQNIVFMLWGSYAQKKRDLINNNHLVLCSSHPSPFSVNRGFDGCRHFSKANAYLTQHNHTPIEW